MPPLVPLVTAIPCWICCCPLGVGEVVTDCGIYCGHEASQGADDVDTTRDTGQASPHASDTLKPQGLGKVGR